MSGVADFCDELLGRVGGRTAHPQSKCWGDRPPGDGFSVLWSSGHPQSTEPSGREKSSAQNSGPALRMDLAAAAGIPQRPVGEFLRARRRNSSGPRAKFRWEFLVPPGDS